LGKEKVFGFFGGGIGVKPGPFPRVWGTKGTGTTFGEKGKVFQFPEG